MMACIARGHTGRAIEATRLVIAAFTTINLAAIAWVFGSIVMPDFQVPVIGLSGSLWAGSFALYLIKYVPILTGARIDGRPG